MDVNRERARTALERDLQRRREEPTIAPRSGWIRAIRDALGMSAAELAARVGVSKGRITQIERAERDSTLTLATLERVAAGLGCRVEYVLIPERPLDAMVKDRALEKATTIIASVDHTMALEDQMPDAEATEARIAAAADQLVDSRGLWA